MTQRELHTGRQGADQREAEVILRAEKSLHDAEPARLIEVEDVEDLRVEALVRPVQLSALDDKGDAKDRGSGEEKNQRAMTHGQDYCA
jgi:hypothetical protein